MSRLAVRDRAAGAARAPFMAVAADEVTRAALRRAAADQGWHDAAVLSGSLGEAAHALADVPTPGVLVIDLDRCDDPLAEVNALADVCDSGTRLIALGTINDVGVFRGLLALGVEDYLLKPVSADALGAALVRPARRRPGPVEGETPATGRLVAVIGTRGGAGASTIAVNTAWLAANRLGRRVVLIDLDLHFGTTALALDLEPGRGFREALENPGRIDDLFIERAVVRQGDRLSLLAAEEALDNPPDFDPAALESLLAKLRATFDLVVVDLPRAAFALQGPVMAAADAIAVVGEPTLAGLRDSVRFVRHLAKTVPNVDSHVVLNRVGALGKAELGRDEFARLLGAPVRHVIPFDAKATARAAAGGMPLAAAAKGSRTAAALDAICRALAEAGANAGPAPLWRRLFGGGA